MKELTENWKIWCPDSEPVSASEPKRYRRISLCSTCMGRSADLERTLIRNIRDNSDYPNLEFIILNYNSYDNLQRFMASKEMRQYIRNGVVKYYVTRFPQKYSVAHSRNIAFKVASGQIVTNVEPDCFVGAGFAAYLNKLAEICPEKAFFCNDKRLSDSRIALYKNDFISLGGYNENFIGYGYHDQDLLSRSMILGYTLMQWAGQNDNFSTKLQLIKTKQNFLNVNKEETERHNFLISLFNINSGIFVANQLNKNWGQVPDLYQYKP